MVNYDLVASINSKMKQGCTVEVEINPEEAELFFNKNYTVVMSGRLYDSLDSTSFMGLPEVTFTYFIPEANFTFEELDDVIKTVEAVDSKEFVMDFNGTDSGEIK